MKVLRALPVALLASGVLVVGATAPAFAGSDGYSWNDDVKAGSGCSLAGWGQFKNVGDDVLAYDSCADGWGSYTRVRIIATGRTEVCQNTQGAANPEKWCTGWDFTEGYDGSILAQAYDNGVWKTSGGVGYFVA